MSQISSPENKPYSSLSFEGNSATLSFQGNVDLSTCAILSRQFPEIISQLSSATLGHPLTISGREVVRLDTAGSWLLLELKKALEKKGILVSFQDFAPSLRGLIEHIEQVYQHHPDVLPFTKKSENSWMALIIAIGENSLKTWQKACDLTAFLGEVILTLARLPTSRHQVRLISFIAQLEQVGLNALPIVGLISFLVGVILTFQGADQLKRLGAEIYTVNLVGISVLREIGILLTAIVVAGRSGSAFTAQIGSMKLNQEIDALETMGLSPLIFLVLPRIFALVVIMPFLTFFADMMGLLGGALMSDLSLGIPIPLFLSRLKLALTPWTFWIGIIKAPVFGFMIGLVGCFEGLAVKGGAESVGRHTTKSVVESIFLVIVADALFSVLFTVLGI